MSVFPLVTKGLIGAGAIAVTTTCVVFRDDLATSLNIKEKNYSKFDEKILEIVKGENSDIVFEVDNKALGFSGDKETIIISTKISEENKTNLKGITSIDQLRRLNSSFGISKDWSWECQVELEKDSDSKSASDLENKTKLTDSASGQEGFLVILGKDLTDESNSNNKSTWKKAKVKLVEACLKGERKWNENKLTSKIKFIVTKGTEANETSKLYFKDTNTFEDLFILPLKLNEKDEKLIELAKGSSGIQFTVDKTPTSSDFTNFNQSKVTTTFEFTTTPQNESTWTWECIINFNKGSASQKDLNDEQKNILIKDSNQGFFDKLKSTGTNNKNLKIRFIKNCASVRSTSSSTENKITSTKDFTFIDKDNKLAINQREFNKWFKNSDNNS